MRAWFHLLYLVALAHATAIPSAGDLAARAVTPVSFVALGDSFGAGIGAGKFFPAADGQKDPDRNNKCARKSDDSPVA